MSMNIEIFSIGKHNCHMQVGNQELVLNNDNVYKLYNALTDYLISTSKLIPKNIIENHGKQ